VITFTTQLNTTGRIRRVLKIFAKFGSCVELSRKSDHIARCSPTATKTVGDSRDLVLFAWTSEISTIEMYML